MSIKKNKAQKKPVTKKTANASAKTAKKPYKDKAKAKKAPMVLTVDTFKKVGNGKLKAVAPKANVHAKKTITVVVKTAPCRPCKSKMAEIKKSVAKKIAAAKNSSKKTGVAKKIAKKR